MAKPKAKASASQPKAGHKIIDVAHPNASAPSTNSKSVIIKHQPMMRDPMMAAPAPEVEVTKAEVVPDAAVEPATVRRERVIMPDIAAPVAPAAVAAPAAEQSAEPVATDSKPSESFTVSESIPEDDSRSFSSEKSPQAADADAEDEVEQRRKVLDELVEKQTYFLPINSIGHHKKRQLIILGTALAVILGLAWLDIALDAELIQIDGIEAPTNFFTN